MSRSFDDAFDRIASLVGYDDWAQSVYEPAVDYVETPAVSERTCEWAKKTLQELKYRGIGAPGAVNPFEESGGSLMIEWTAPYRNLELHADGDVIVLVDPEDGEMHVDAYDKCNRNPRKTADVFEQTVNLYTEWSSAGEKRLGADRGGS